MRLNLLAIAVLCAAVQLISEEQVAAQELPVGEFRVEPMSGAIGSVVTVSGDFDRDITQVSLRCRYRDLGEETYNLARVLAVPSSSFTFDYTIPAEMNVVQYTDVFTLPLGGECAFYAEAGHKLATAQVDFTVIEDPATMPLAGLRNTPDGASGPSIIAVVLAIGAITLVTLAWREGIPPDTKALPPSESRNTAGRVRHAAP